MSLARGEVMLLSLPPLEAREVWGAEGDLDLGRVAELMPARLPLGLLSHCLAYCPTTEPCLLLLPTPDDLRLLVAGDSALITATVNNGKYF